MTWSIAEPDAYDPWRVSVFLVFWEGKWKVTLSRYLHHWSLQWSGNLWEQCDGIAGIEVDWSPEWQ